MNPPWFEDSESDDDDWMSQNIAKYEHLFMYKLEHSPLKIKIHPEGKHILLLSRTKKSKFELAIFKLPEKLLAVNKEEEGLLNSRELTLKCGFYHEQIVLDCEFWPHSENSIIALLLGKLELYKVKEDESDLLVMNQSISIDPCKLIKVCDKTVVLISDYSVQLVDHDFKVSKTLKETGVLDCLVTPEAILILKWNELKIEDLSGNLKNTIYFGFNLSSPVALFTFGSSILLAAKLNDTLLHAEFKLTDTTLHFEELSEYSDCETIKWTKSGSLIAVQEKKIQVYNRTSKNVTFEHEASKKSTKILDFSPHPSVATQKILLCIDDAKSLQAFSIESAK